MTECSHVSCIHVRARVIFCGLLPGARSCALPSTPPVVRAHFTQLLCSTADPVRLTPPFLVLCWRRSSIWAAAATPISAFR
jgi:hypothetical protein